MFIETKKLPQKLQDILKGLNFHRRDIEIKVQDKVSLFMPGSRGNRGFVTLVNLATYERKDFKGSWGGDNMFTQKAVDTPTGQEHIIPSNCIAIKGYQGNLRYAEIITSSMNIIPAIEDNTMELSENEIKVVKCFKGLKAFARRDELTRPIGGYNRFGTGLNDSQLDSLFDSMVTKGLLKRNKRGALSLSIEGKNAAKNN